MDKATREAMDAGAAEHVTGVLAERRRCGWCSRCGVAYEPRVGHAMPLPTCECAGDPPVDLRLDEWQAYLLTAARLRWTTTAADEATRAEVEAARVKAEHAVAVREAERRVRELGRVLVDARNKAEALTEQSHLSDRGRSAARAVMDTAEMALTWVDELAARLEQGA